MRFSVAPTLVDTIHRMVDGLEGYYARAFLAPDDPLYPFERVIEIEIFGIEGSNRILARRYNQTTGTTGAEISIFVDRLYIPDDM